jgi:hypothetical protein
MAYIAKGHKLPYRSLFVHNPLHPRDYVDIIISSLLFLYLGLCLPLLQPCALRAVPTSLGNIEYTAMAAVYLLICLALAALRYKRCCYHLKIEQKHCLTKFNVWPNIKSYPRFERLVLHVGLRSSVLNTGFAELQSDTDTCLSYCSVFPTSPHYTLLFDT